MLTKQNEKSIYIYTCHKYSYICRFNVLYICNAIRAGVLNDKVLKVSGVFVKEKDSS